ncbi:MAG: HipA domain-containing protein [Bacilli bacterium]|jgi:serine/threonine-protein kinase HipA|nr:HipA domain-containing protein [Bacilli bacterium]
MKNSLERKAFVYLGSAKEQDLPLGTLFEDDVLGNVSYSFEFEESFLKSHNENALLLDPDLYFYSGRQYVTAKKPIFGFIADSAPDRWGRLLRQTYEMRRAKEENRPFKPLTEFDYLLGVSDQARMGALRFKKEKDGQFLSSDIDSPIPPLTSLRDLEEAAYEIDQGHMISDGKLRCLLAPGSSLGGARPKASICFPDGSLWIAKFPAKNDKCNVSGLEMIAHDMAQKCLIDVPEAKLDKFSDRGYTFLTKRFDRHGNKRLHFSSAMALLGKKDGEEASYLDIVSFLKSYGSPQRLKQSLEELFTRMVFNIMISNTDDHLRNHGFLLKEDGWAISPAYDINPSAEKKTLTLSLDGYDRTLNLDCALRISPYFGLTEKEAKEKTSFLSKTITDSLVPLSKKYEIANSDYELLRNACQCALTYALSVSA